MATMKAKMEKIMEYTGASTEKVLALDAYQFDAAYTCVLNIEENLKALKRFGLEVEKEDCGCGGCEFALAECVAESAANDELVELEEFVGAVYRLIEEYRRAENEVQ